MAKEHLHRFKRGSGENRDPYIKVGNRKGTKHIASHIHDMMHDETFEVQLKDGTAFKGRPVEAILKVAIAKAMSGDMKALDMLFKYGYGQKQVHEMQNSPMDSILSKYGLSPSDLDDDGENNDENRRLEAGQDSQDQSAESDVLEQDDREDTTA